MTKLLVRSSLAHFNETELAKNSDDDARRKGWNWRHYATWTVWVPTNSASTVGSPSSRSIETTSARLVFSSSRVSPCECAPGQPGINPTKRPVSESFSMTAVNFFTRIVYQILGFRTNWTEETEVLVSSVMFLAGGEVGIDLDFFCEGCLGRVGISFARGVLHDEAQPHSPPQEAPIGDSRSPWNWPEGTCADVASGGAKSE